MPTKKTPKKSYTITQAAKKLGVTRAAVHKAIQDKRLNAKWGKTTRIMKALLIDEKDLKGFEVDLVQQSYRKKQIKK
jgi:excisionase family DNA binding protein